jgi:YD repeat-containing protein
MNRTVRNALPYLVAGVMAVSTGCAGARPFKEASTSAQAAGGAKPRRSEPARAATPACRTGIATYRIVTTGAGVQSTTEGSCTFNAETIEGTCTNNYTDTQGTRMTSVSVTRHATRGDVVDEVSVIPPLNRSLGTTTTTSGTRVSSSTCTSTHEYDAQKRLLSTRSTSQPGGQTTTITYTAWDSAGRPTSGTSTGGRQSLPQSFTYDNATRTQTNTNAGVTCTQTFDVNGNPAVGRCANGATATTTVLTTQEICR